MPASFLETLRSARKIEWIALLVVLALAALVMTGDYGSQDTSIEKRLEEILCSIEGAGNVKAMVTQDEDGTTIGVLIAAQGGGDIAVRLKLAQAVKAVLDVDLSRIEVVKMAG